MINVIADAIKKVGLGAVDVDIGPTRSAKPPTFGAGRDLRGGDLTSMNGERRMRLTEKYMDHP